MAVDIYNESALPFELIDYIEKEFECRYICDTQMRIKGKWEPYRIALFYKDEPFEGSNSNWVGYTYTDDGNALIVDASESVEPDPYINAIKTPEGYMYSAYKHDMQCYVDDEHELSIDGGREHLEVTGDPTIMKLVITPEGLVPLQ